MMDDPTRNAALDALEVRLAQVGYDLKFTEKRIADVRKEIANDKAMMARLYKDRDILVDAIAKLRRAR